ncbi:MAG: hypothetical protein QME81_00505 [bacterium]|nr:hypothetical protein [bacterium]
MELIYVQWFTFGGVFLCGLMSGMLIQLMLGMRVKKKQEKEDEVKVSIESMKRKEDRLEEEINLLKREVGLLKPQAA